MAQTVKITPATGLLEFIGDNIANKPVLQHDNLGNLTLTLQASKKFTVGGNLKVNGKVTIVQQTLVDGASIAWNFNNGANATVTLAGARTLAISNMEAGDTGLILVKQDASGGRTLSLPGGSSIVGGGSYTASSTANTTDVLGVYYDGTTYWWTIGYNTVAPPISSIGITGADFVIANSPLTANGNIGLALATVNSNVGQFGSATAVPVITVNSKGLVTAVSTTAISIPTNLDSLTDVTLTNSTSGQLLQFDGSQWVNWTNNFLTEITSAQVITALGYTPYNATNPNGYISSYTETDTLASVTGRGATTNTAITLNGNVTLGNAADLTFVDLAGTFPTSGKGFDWTLNNDGARIYAIQPSSDSIDLVFQLRDNATTNDRFVFWVDDYQGAAFDKYPLIIRGGTEFDLVDSGLFVRGTQVLTNARVLQNIRGDISMFTNDSEYITNAALSGYATQVYVNTAISNLVDTAPGTLDTLNELAAALGDDPNFATTVATNIAGKVSKAGDTMTGTLTINRNVAGLIFNRDAVSNYNGIYYSTATQPKWFIGMRENLGSNNHIHYSEELGRDVLTLNVANGNATVFGTISAAGYNDANWNSAYNDTITTAAVSGTLTKTLTLTQRDGGTVTATWTDIDTDTNTDAQTLSISGSTISISGGNSITIPATGITQATADDLYVNVSGDTMTGNLYVFPISENPAQFQLGGTNPELYVSAKTGTARAFINRASSDNQATLMFTTGLIAGIGTAWDFTGSPFWSMGMTNNNNSDSFKLGYLDIFDPNSVALEITSANVAYFKYVPYADGNLLATQSWVTSQGFIIGESDTLASVTARGNIANTKIQIRTAGNAAGGNIQLGPVSDGVSKWAYITAQHFNSSTEPEGFAIIGGLANNGSNSVVIGGNIYETNPSTEIQFWTHGSDTHNLGGTLRGIINSAGNWGVGTGNPNQRLSVEGGSIYMNANNASANYYLFLNKRSGQDGGILFNRDNASDWQLTNASGNGDLIFYSYGTGTEAIVFKRATGRVGIGTINPDANLHIVSGASQAGFGSSGINGDTWFPYSNGQNYIRGITNFDSHSVYFTGGRIGISTYTPQKTLDVVGTGIMAAFGGTFGPGQFAGLSFGYSESNSNNDSYKKSALVFERTDNHGQGGNASGKIHFLLNNIASGSATSLAHSVMVIDTDSVATQGSARVGIGRTNPATTLDVNGVITASGGNSTNWNTAFGYGNHASAGYRVNSVDNTAYVYAITYLTQNYDFTLDPRQSIGSMSIKLWDNYFNNSGLGVDYGSLLDIYGRGGHVHSQFYMDADNSLHYRSSPYDSGWNPWYQIWTSGTLTNLSQLTNDLGNYGGFLINLPSHNHDDRYYTETESDTRFVNATGDTMSGNLTLSYANPHINISSIGGSVSYLQLSDGSSNGYLIKNITGGTGNNALPGALYTYTDSDNAFQHLHVGTPLFTILSNGNVGIGTTAPGTKLVVASAVTAPIAYFGASPLNASSINALIRLQSGTIPQSGGDVTGESGFIFEHSFGTGGVNGDANGGFIKSIRQNAFGIATSVNTSLIFASTIANVDTERMRITSGGSVLIATSENPYNLGSLVVLHDSTLTRTYFRRGVELIEIAPSDGTGSNLISSSFTTSGSAYKPLSLSGRQNSADLHLATTGNVQIGTTTDAGFKLDVNGTGRFTSFLTVDSNGAFGQAVESSVRLGTSSSGNTSATFALVARNLAGTMAFGVRGDLVSFFGGNVGIGTTAPGTKLEITTADSATTVYPLSLTNPNNQAGDGGGAGIRFSTSSGPGGNGNEALKYSSIEAFDVNNFGSNSGLSFTVSNGYTKSKALVINRLGNVGIGTTAPTAPLDTNGVRIGRDFSIASRATVRLDAKGTGFPADILFGHTAAANQTGWDGVYWSLSSRASEASNKFYIYRAAGNPGGSGEEVILALQPDGNVGIGTTSPTNRLQIGSVGSSGYGGNDLVIGNGIQVMAFYQASTISAWYTNTSFALMPSGAGSLGRLGIGNDNPQFKLDVAGNARFTSNVSIGTDYNGFALNVNGTTYVIAGDLFLNVGYKVVNTSGTSSITFLDDVLNVKGALVPAIDGTYNLGTADLRWRTINAIDLNLSGNISAANLSGTNTGDQTLSISGSTISISGGNSITIPAGGISQATADSLYVNASGDTMSGDLQMNGTAVTFRDGAGDYSNIIRAAAYPSEGFPDGVNYWLEYQSKGGHHFVLNTDGGVGGGANPMDDFCIWQGAIDGDRLLEVSNTGTLTIADRLIELSSIRYKTQVESLTPALDKVLQLRPVHYVKIGGTGSTEIGLIAEEVAEIYPELIKYNSSGEVDGINYTRIAPILIKTIQEQQEIIKNLVERIENLENR